MIEVEQGLSYSKGTTPSPIDEDVPYFRVNDRLLYAFSDVTVDKTELARCEELESQIPALMFAKSAKRASLKIAASAKASSTIVHLAGKCRYQCNNQSM